MLHRLRSFLRLPASERLFAIRALFALALVRLALWLLPFRKVRALVDRLSRVPLAASDASCARAVRRAVDRAARTIPGSACLAQSVTAEFLLRRAGQIARVSIGVALDGKPLEAHAWVESAGVLVTGDSADLGKYRTLTVLGNDSRIGGRS